MPTPAVCLEDFYSYKTQNLTPRISLNPRFTLCADVTPALTDLYEQTFQVVIECWHTKYFLL